MKIRLCGLIIFLLAVSSSVTVRAQSLIERLDRIDRNRDGEVSREETANAPWFDRLLRRMDRNRNGVLERNEISGTGLKRKPDDSKISEEPAHTEHLDIPYADIEGVDPNLLSLDLYVPKDAKDAPVMMWLHGGSWQVGDKGGTRGSPLQDFFLGKGWIFASINYRLTPEGRHPINAEDVARAIAWVHDNIAEFGGSPKGLYLMGHSAGGHLAAIVTTNDRFLKAISKSPAILNAVLLLDPAVLDVPQMLNGLSRNLSSPYTINFGTNPDQWIDASPFHHIQRDASLPPVIFLLAYGQQNKVDQALATSAALREIGVRAELIDAFSYKSHAAIAREFGLQNDLPTETAWRFLHEIEISRRSGTPVSRGLGDHHVMKPSEAVRLAGRREIGEYQSRLLFKHLDQDRDGRLAPGETREPIRRYFSALDQNGDGHLDEAEIIRGYTGGPLLPSLPTTKGQRSEERAPTTSQTPAETSDTFTNLKFTCDFVSGKDRHGKPMGGTECNYIVSHNGKLWAGLSCWKHDTSVSPLLGPQVLVKHAADADWELDFCFGPDYGTTKILRSVAFTTDRHGEKLATPVPLLIADATRWRPPYDVGIWTRDDATGEWIRTVIAPEQPSNSVYKKGFSTEVRIIVDHVDEVTGIHHVFACTNQGRIHRGAYDPSAVGRIAWEKEPELDDRLRRTSSGGEANDDLYVSIGMDASDPENGGLFHRIDGREPFWKRVAGWAHHKAHQERNLTSELRFSPIPNPDEKSANILLGTQAHPVNKISRIYSDDDFRMALDLDVQAYVAEHIPGARVMSIAANGFAPFRHPDTGEQVHIGGLWLYFRDQTDTQDSNAAWYLVRYSDGAYRHGQIFDPDNPIPNRGIPGGLRDARTICASPFPEDEGRVFYFGGFNCGTHYIKEKLVNTAWIYKATLPAAGSVH